MSNLFAALVDFGRMDALAAQDTPVHRLDPRAKVIVTLLFIFCVASFHKYAILALLPFVIFPVALMAAGAVPAGYLFKKLLLVAPLALLIGVFNPIFDREAFTRLGPVAISGGWVSFCSIAIRFILCLSAALILIATTGVYSIALALERLWVPRALVIQMLFLYRYIFALLEEFARIHRAWSLRAPGASRIAINVFASLTGQLLLRTLDRAQRIHWAMLGRGFDGRFHLSKPLKSRWTDWAYGLGWTAFFVLARLWNLPQLIGEGVMRALAG
ncbi:MAG: cobalt ECF transporter T component CbiQ [Candidatus Sumerlaeota bacterium]|nr:cobalt ECF transporter T component CbiQ [Candidatus Sumerlaeota bacterium]